MKFRLGLLGALFLAFGAGDAWAQERTVRGTVTDEVSGQGIGFPQIAVRGTTIGTVGGEDGTYALTGVPAGDVVLVVQRIGYRTTEVSVAAGQNTADVSLVRDYLQVEELVVTGRATETRRLNLPNAVESIDGEELQRVPQQTVDKALQGRVSGAVISRNSGAPGGGLQINLRGSSSINAAAEPVYVVDGVIVSNVSIPSNQNEITAAASGSNPSLEQDNMQNRLADLNPEDIESIEVLKGASAAAIYGSKASNGVVIITTKAGQPGPVRVNLRFQGGFFSLSNTLGSRVFESAEDAATVFEQGLVNEFFEPGRTFDNESALSQRKDFSWEGSGNVSGGSDGLQYYGSALWKEDEGIVDNTGFEKQSGRVNLQTSIADVANINLNTNVIHSTANRGITNNGNNTISYYMVLPNVPNFFDLSPEIVDGEEVFPENPFVLGGSNPLQTAALVENAEDVWRFIGSANVDVELVDTERHRFRIVQPIGVDFFNQENRIFSPPEAFFEDVDGLPGTALLSNSDNLNINYGLNGVWNYEFSEGLSLTTSAGLQYEYRDLAINRIIGKDLTGGKDKVDAATQVQVRENRAKVEDFGFYVQEELITLDDRLLVTGMVRFDQSSTAGDPGKLFAYPKAAASFRIPGAPGSLFEEVKLRAAFGQTGNQPLCDIREGCQKFTSLELDNNIEGEAGFQLEGTAGALDLRPERMTEFEGGVDLTGLDNRLRLELTGYVQNISDLILERTTAPSTGFGDEIINGGELRNYGIETSLGVTPVRSESFTWVSRTTFFLNRSEVTDLVVPDFEPDAGFGQILGGFFVEEGRSLTQIVGTDVTCTGDPAQDEVIGDGLECVEGQQALRRLGDTEPDFNVALVNDFTFGDFRLYSLFEWRKGQEVTNLTQLLYDLAQNSPDWFPEDGSIDPIQECLPNCSGAERGPEFLSSGIAWTQPASFFKAREISLSYTLPQSVLARMFGGFFDSVSLRASARDLFTITPYDGLDPEVSNFGNQQVGRSIDVAPYPPSRSFWFGFDVSL